MKLNKNTLVAAINSKESPDVTDSLANILQELRVIRDNQEATNEKIDVLSHSMTRLETDNQELKKRTNDNESEIQRLKEENQTLFKIVKNQQTFLETVDARERQLNAVITGLSEQPDALGMDDRAKVDSILAIVAPDTTSQVTEIKRLGEQNGSRNRPIMATFASKKARDEATKNSKELDDYKGPNKDIIVKKVYLKKDLHPAWRREHARLRKLAKDESKKPENQGIEVKYDFKQRVVTRAGQVIDRFNPLI